MKPTLSLLTVIAVTAVLIEAQPTTDQEGNCCNGCHVFAYSFAKLQRKVLELEAKLSTTITGVYIVLQQNSANLLEMVDYIV